MSLPWAQQLAVPHCEQAVALYWAWTQPSQAHQSSRGDSQKQSWAGHEHHPYRRPSLVALCLTARQSTFYQKHELSKKVCMYTVRVVVIIFTSLTNQPHHPSAPSCPYSVWRPPEGHAHCSGRCLWLGLGYPEGEGGRGTKSGTTGCQERSPGSVS